MTWPHAHGLTECLHLLRRHKSGMIVLVACEGESEAFDRVADKAGRLFWIGIVEGIKNGREIVPTEIIHQRREFGVAPPLDQSAGVSLVADLVVEPLAPRRATRKHQRRVELIGT